MDLNTVCVMLALFVVLAAVARRRGWLRAPSPLDDIVDAHRRERDQAEAQQELLDVAARIRAENEEPPTPPAKRPAD